MGIVNKVINILVLVLALVAAAVSFLLAEKRKGIIAGWDKMTSSISQTAAALDSGSGTEYAAKLKKDNLKHTKHAEIDKVLNELPKQAKELVTQRDKLAGAMTEIASALELEGIAETREFQNLAKYTGHKEILIKKAKELQARNNSFIRNIAESIKKMGVNTTVKHLKDSKTQQAHLKEFDTKVAKTRKRLKAYEAHIARMASAIGTGNPSLSSDDFHLSLNDTVAAAERVVSDYEQLKRDLNSQKNKTQTVQTRFETKEQAIVNVEKRLKSKDKEISKLKKQIAKLSGGGEGDSKDIEIIEGGDPRLLKFLKGRVVEINKKWDFVVIDLGKTNKVKQKIGEKEIENDVSLPLGKEMIIARNIDDGSEYVGKIEIVKVYDDCAIGNIVPGSQNRNRAETGDIVYFSDDILEKIISEKTEPEKTEVAEKTSGTATLSGKEKASEKKKDDSGEFDLDSDDDFDVSDF